MLGYPYPRYQSMLCDFEVAIAEWGNSNFLVIVTIEMQWICLKTGCTQDGNVYRKKTGK